MIRTKGFMAGQVASREANSDGEDQLVLIDDAKLVSAFAEAGQRLGKRLVCARCSDPAQALRAVVVLIEGQSTVGTSAGSVGFCCECYRDLDELLFHNAVLRASERDS
jgi:hypothetical protein